MCQLHGQAFELYQQGVHLVSTCWFSILVRRLLKRASFTSLHDLRDRILAFIDYFNRTMAKPFQWKFQGYSVPGWSGQLLLPGCTSYPIAKIAFCPGNWPWLALEASPPQPIHPFHLGWPYQQCTISRVKIQSSLVCRTNTTGINHCYYATRSSRLIVT